MIAVGALKVLTNPLSTDCCARAGAPPSTTSAAVPIRSCFIPCSSHQFAKEGRHARACRAAEFPSDHTLVEQSCCQKPHDLWLFASLLANFGSGAPACLAQA